MCGSLCNIDLYIDKCLLFMLSVVRYRDHFLLSIHLYICVSSLPNIDKCALLLCFRCEVQRCSLLRKRLERPSQLLPRHMSFLPPNIDRWLLLLCYLLWGTEMLSPSRHMSFHPPNIDKCLLFLCYLLWGKEMPSPSKETRNTFPAPSQAYVLPPS